MHQAMLPNTTSVDNILTVLLDSDKCVELWLDQINDVLTQHDAIQIPNSTAMKTKTLEAVEETETVSWDHECTQLFNPESKVDVDLLKRRKRKYSMSRNKNNKIDVIFQSLDAINCIVNLYILYLLQLNHPIILIWN